MITRQNILLHFLILLLSIVLSFITTYFYFDWFQHKRYFGTISKVVKTETDMIEGIGKIEPLRAQANRTHQEGSMILKENASGSAPGCCGARLRRWTARGRPGVP